jgi:dihydropteroate synthase
MAAGNVETGILKRWNQQKKNKPEPWVAGILNITPDSFFDGGFYLSEKEQINRVEQMISQGAAMIDVGAVSTRPGAEEVSLSEEKQRLKPVVSAIRRLFPEILISVDTFRSEIAQMAVGEGADLINDVYAGRFDPLMLKTIAKLKVPYVLMHMKGTPSNMQDNPVYGDVVGEVCYFFEQMITKCREIGISEMIMDPGFGFGKNLADNYRLAEGLEQVTAFGYPVMVGFSRKSMIRNALGVTIDKSLNGTTVLNTVAILKGAAILRVHDVAAAYEVIRLCSLLAN